MKHYIKLVVPMILLGCLLFSCKDKDTTHSNSNDKLENSLSKLNDYLLERDELSNGEFFKYLQDNPNSSFEDIVERDFVDKTTVLKEIKIIEQEVNTKDGDQVLAIAKKVVDSRFLHAGPDTDSGFRICIFCCTGCLNKIKKDHCITILFWDMGPGC